MARSSRTPALSGSPSGVGGLFAPPAPISSLLSINSLSISSLSICSRIAGRSWFSKGASSWGDRGMIVGGPPMAMTRIMSSLEDELGGNKGKKWEMY